MHQLGKMACDQKTAVVKAVARMYALATSSILTLIQQAKTVYPVTPRDLATTTTMPRFVAVINEYRPQLEVVVGEAGIHAIGFEFKELQRYYLDDKDFHDAVVSFDYHLAQFSCIWALGEAGLKFPYLAIFCGGVASVFPNTATVESDFSLIGCEK